jgi:hypothetical protein
VHILRNMIFNEAELAENINVESLPKDITAPINITITSIFTKNKENESIAARTRKTIFKIELPKEAVEFTKISTKFINIIIPRRNPNIVYENLIKENPTLPKTIIVKTIPNNNKPSYETAMANPKIF